LFEGEKRPCDEQFFYCHRFYFVLFDGGFVDFLFSDPAKPQGYCGQDE